MFIYKSMRLRYQASMLLFLYLITTLLPAYPISVSAQANACAGENHHSTSVTAVTAASADQEVVIPQKTVDFAIYEANWRHHYKDAELVKASFLDLFLMADSGVSILGATTLQGYLAQLDKAIPPTSVDDRNLRPYDEIVHTALDLALKNPEMAPLVPWVWDTINKEYHGNSSLLPDTASKMSLSGQRYDLGARMIALAPQWVFQVYDCAKKNPEFATKVDQVHGGKLQASVNDSAKTIIEKNPDVSVPTEIREGIAADGTVSISLNQLKELSQTEFEKIHASIDDMQKTLNEIDAKQNSIIDYLSNQLEKEKAQELAKKKAAEQQLKLDAIKSSISIITIIAGQVDPEFAKDFSVVANSSLKVGEAIHGWLKATAGLGSLDKVSSLSTVVMTGNVLGAVMNIISLFGDSGPTPEEMILEEIGKLREQVDQLRTEMHDRFDRIDEGLNTIYTTMHERFDQIDIQLGKINGNLQEIQQSLITLDLQLSRIERNNFELINAVSRRSLLEAINGGLGYRHRVGTGMPQAAFAQFENQFHSWASLHAFDPGNVGPTQRDYSDAGLLKELTTYPIDANLNYLNGWMVTHGLPILSNKPLPSPRDWLLASRAYTQLSLEEAELMATFAKNDPQRHARLQEVSLDMEAAMQHISTQITANGPQGNNSLFSMVIAHYRQKVIGLDEAIQTLETDFLNEVQTQRLQRREPFNLYGGVDQVVAYRTPELIDGMSCGNPAANVLYNPPNGLMQDIPNFERYNLAEYLKLGEFSMCLSDEWLNPIEVCSPEFPNGPKICRMFANHTSFLTVKFSSVPILVKGVYEGYQLLPASGSATWTKDNWRGGIEYVSKFETQSIIVPPSPELAMQQGHLLETVITIAENELASYQKELYGRILNAMTNGLLKSKTVELGGSKALIDHLVTLGLSRAVSNDEFVHAMLYGNQQLVDDSQLMQSYTLRMNQPITVTNLLVNPRQLLGQTAEQRSEAFSGLINGYLDAITAKTHVEAPDYIANTRRALDLTMRIIQVEPQPISTPMPGGGQPTPTPSGGQPIPTPASGEIKRIFLPLAKR